MKRNVGAGLLSLIIIGLLIGGCSDDNESARELTISRTNYTILKVSAGYTEAELNPQLIEVTNSGKSSVTVNIALGGTNPQSFTLSADTLSLAAKASGSFTVSPQTGLEKGSYTATITLSAQDYESKSVNVSFTVESNFHVYIAFGQSNMQGPGAIREQDKTGIDYRRWQTLNVVAGTYAGVSRAKGQWYEAVPPLIIPDANLVNYLGLNIGLSPADYFGRTLTEGTPEYIKIGVVAVANGDMALAAFHKRRAGDYRNGIGTLSGRPSDTEMQGMTRYINAGYADMYDAIIQNARIAQQDGVIKGIIVHQGESGQGFSDITWAALLKEIYDDMLSDLGLAPNSIPILLGQTWDGGSGNTDGALASDNVIRAVLPNAWIISSIGCTGRTGNGQPDNIHFGSEGLQLLGTRYGEKMLELNY